jgi:hypothetical protein
MERCEARTNGICTRPATWKQSVHTGVREAGRFLYYSYWCDEHAERIAEKRRRDWLSPPRMVRTGEPRAIAAGPHAT